MHAPRVGLAGPPLPPLPVLLSIASRSVQNQYCYNRMTWFCFALLFTAMIKGTTPCDPKEKP